MCFEAVVATEAASSAACGAEIASAAGSMSAADAAGVALMGADAGLSGAALDAFVASGGTMGSAAAGGSGVGLGAAGFDLTGALKTAATVGSPVASVISSAAQVDAARRSGKIASVPPSTVMPIYGASLTRGAERGNEEAQLRRRGRASTFLTETGMGDKLGS